MSLKSASLMPPMSDNDILCRLEQTLLFCATLRHFGYSEEKLFYRLMEGYDHTEYDNAPVENGNNVLAELIFEFMGACEILKDKEEKSRTEDTK